MNKRLLRAKNKLQEILVSSHRLAPVMPFKTYAENYDKNCYHLIEAGRETVVLSNCFFGEESVLPEKQVLPEAYWAELHHGKVIGNSGAVITANHKLLYDMLASCDVYHANMTDQGLFLLFGKPHHIGNQYFYNYLRKKGKRIENGISLASYMSNNSYHFMFQVAAKFYYIELADIDRSVPLLVDEQVLKTPQMKEVVNLLNKDSREIIPLKAEVLYEVDTLYCLSDPNIVIPNRKRIDDDCLHSFAFDKKALDYLRSRIMGPSLPTKKTFPKRIFLSRRDCNKRRINEDELRPILEKYGFEFVYTGEMDIVSQALMFNQAEHIIGPSGAAFTNLLFCSKGCHVLLFVSYRHNTTCYSSLAAPLGGDIMFLAGNGHSSKLHLGYYKVDSQMLERYLQSIYK